MFLPTFPNMYNSQCNLFNGFKEIKLPFCQTDHCLDQINVYEFMKQMMAFIDKIENDSFSSQNYVRQIQFVVQQMQVLLKYTLYKYILTNYFVE